MALRDDTRPRDDASAAAVADAVIKALQAEVAVLRSENEALTRKSHTGERLDANGGGEVWPA
jgi:hypothetical protein